MARARSVLIVVAAVCLRDGAVLLTQRPRGKHLAGFWEFPGGKVEPHEDPLDALKRELHEELGVELVSAQTYDFAYHRYPERAVLLLFYRAEIVGEPYPREGNPVRWVPLAELDTVELPAADRPLITRLIRD